MNWDLKEVSKDIRCDVLSSIAHVGVGHLGGSLSIVDVLTVLYFEAMKVNPEDPHMAGPFCLLQGPRRTGGVRYPFQARLL